MIGKLNHDRGFAAIGLVQPKTPINVGHVLRAAHCFGAASVAYTGQRYSKAPTDVTSWYRSMPLLNVDDLKNVIPHGATPVAVDLVDGASNLVDFDHPHSAFYVFGPEDGTLGKQTLEWCSKVIMIPTSNCLNLAACVNVVLYDRMAKAHRKQRQPRRPDRTQPPTLEESIADAAAEMSTWPPSFRASIIKEGQHVRTYAPADVPSIGIGIDHD